MFLLSNQLHAERSIRLYGYVLDTDNRGIELVNVYIEGTTTGTSTNRNGYYDLQIDAHDTMVIVYSMLGYETIRQQIYPSQEVLNINVILPTDAEVLEEIEVRGIQKQTGTMDRVEASTARLMPSAAGGGIEGLLITFAGVSQNNELSTQYNVRGGSYDENSVYVNGLEIRRPLLLRSGQQEGLSFVNPDMVSDVQFSAGGFDAQYGDKMSSVLDITYKQPDRFESSIGISILGANVYVGSGDSTYSMMHGIRYKTSKYMLGALETKGNYKPNFVDYQTYLTWHPDMSRKTGKGKTASESRWTMSLLGNYSMNSYRFIPEETATTSGSFTNSRSLQIWYEGQERDLFHSAFLSLGAKYRVNNEINIGFDLTGFYTNEQENFDITGDYILSENPMTESEEEKEDAIVLGTGSYHEHVRNRLQAAVATLAHTGEWKRGNNKMLWGASIQGEYVSDQINEWEWRDSMGYSMPNNPDLMEIYYSMKGSCSLKSIRVQGYLQDTYKWNTDKGNVLLTGGVRLNWWSVNNEVLCSPRVSLTYLPGWKRDFAFRFATGLYYQSPFYKELRDTVTDAMGVTRISLNKDLKAQRSVHVVLGGDYYFRAWGRPFKLTAEAYYKYMDRVVSYTVDNVRVRYSGENDAIAYTTGVDLKLYGELVPGADSWISLSWMRSREDLLNDDRGWMPGPNEQRYAFTMFFQDYIPRLPQYKVHLKFIWSDGLPYGGPRNIASRAMFRTTDYRRIDIGASRVFSAKTDKFMRKSKHVDNWALQFEVFNLADFKNVNSQFWVTDVYGQQWCSPNYLTGRMFNFKVSVDFK